MMLLAFSAAAQECPPDEVWVEVEGTTASVHHDSALFNCVLNLGLEVVQSGYFIEVIEEELPPLADCLCCYDLVHEIRDLAPGTYTVEVRGANGCETIPCGTSQFTIESGTGTIVTTTELSGCGGWQHMIFYGGFEGGDLSAWGWVESTESPLQRPPQGL